MTFIVPDHDEVERAELLAQIAAARQRTAEAKRRSADMSAALRAEVSASQKELELIEQQYAAEITRIREDAQAASSRILGDARARVVGEGVVNGVE
jgi:hypothetical protein